MASIDSYNLTKSITKNPKIRVKETNFGMGFRNILIDGLNADEEVWYLDFVSIDSTAAIALETILLDSVKSTSNFIAWIPPGESTSKNYTAQEIQRKPDGPVLWKITCNLRREYS